VHLPVTVLLASHLADHKISQLTHIEILGIALVLHACAPPLQPCLECTCTLQAPYALLQLTTSYPNNTNNNTHCTTQQAERYNVTIIEMKDMPESGADVAALLNTLLPVDAPVYISFDLDALDPAHAPGVSHWEPGGMTTRLALDTIQNLQ
jgi:Arginase family